MIVLFRLKVAAFIALSLGGVVLVPRSHQDEHRNSVTALEMTQSDVFATSSWNSRAVSVLGVRLGTQRRRVAEKLGSQGFVLQEMVRQQPCLTEERCVVLSKRLLPTGVSVLFDSGDEVRSIEIAAIPADAPRQSKKDCVIKRFQGRTKQLFTHYSESLRTKLFGQEEAKFSEPSAPGSPIVHVRYEYARRGLMIGLRFHAKEPSTPFDTTVVLLHPVEHR